VFEAGRIIERGSFAELLARGASFAQLAANPTRPASSRAGPRLLTEPARLRTSPGVTDITGPLAAVRRTPRRPTLSPSNQMMDAGTPVVTMHRKVDADALHVGADNELIREGAAHSIGVGLGNVMEIQTTARPRPRSAGTRRAAQCSRSAVGREDTRGPGAHPKRAFRPKQRIDP
jgi:hypothetical protein